MTRLKLFLGFLVVAAGVTAAGILLLDGPKNRAIAERKADVARAEHSVEAAIARAKFALSAVGDDLQRSAVVAHFQTVSAYREVLAQLQSELWAKYPKPDDPAQVKARVEEVGRRTELVDGFLDGLVANIDAVADSSYWMRHDKKTFLARTRREFVERASFGPDSCLFWFVFRPLEAFVRGYGPEGGKEGASAPLSFAVVVDTQGTGRADTRDASWSNVRGFAAGNRLLSQALVQGRPVFGAMRGPKDGEAFLALARPIYFKRRLLGAVLIGRNLDTVFADEIEQATRLPVLLVRGDVVLAASARSRAHGADLVHEVRRAVSGRTRRCAEGASFACTAVPLVTGGGDPSEIFVVAAGSLADAGASLRQARNTLVGAIIVLALLSLLFGLWQERAIFREFESVDQGIHEIIAGNPDYEFPFDESSKSMANSMAQSLNLMLALLLGRPLPEDEHDDDARHWADNLFPQADARGGPADASSGGGLAGPVPGGRSAVELAQEPADAYYKRLYHEYVEARAGLGQDNSSVTYVRFVEKVARIERRLKEQQGCRMVRFNVSAEGDKVVLTPVFLTGDEERAPK